MSGLTREDIIDLDRWYSIQFASREMAAAALERYRRYRAEVAARQAERGLRATEPAEQDAPDLAA
ncbi:MAG: hypothetical protein WEB13_02945 [Dehalococcoidia bacterium]